MFVGLSVGLSAFYWPHDICPLCGAASEEESKTAGDMQKGEHGKTVADTGPEGCGSPAVCPNLCLGDASTKTTIMTVHVNKLCRLRHLNGESFRSLRQVISCCFTPRNIR